MPPPRADPGPPADERSAAAAARPDPPAAAWRDDALTGRKVVAGAGIAPRCGETAGATVPAAVPPIARADCCASKDRDDTGAPDPATDLVDLEVPSAGRAAVTTLPPALLRWVCSPAPSCPPEALRFSDASDATAPHPFSAAHWRRTAPSWCWMLTMKAVNGPESSSSSALWLGASPAAASAASQRFRRSCARCSPSAAAASAAASTDGGQLTSRVQNRAMSPAPANPSCDTASNARPCMRPSIAETSSLVSTVSDEAPSSGS